MKRRARGVVKSDKMDKTITVSLEKLQRHGRYGKYVRRRSSCMAHDPHNAACEGDVVEIEETRPLSRHKSWRLLRVVRRASQAEPTVAQALTTPESEIGGQ